MVVRRGVVLLALLALGSCDEGKAGPPLSPSPTATVQGTYVLTISTSPSCPAQGSWRYRADITQKDQSLGVSVYQLNGESVCGGGISGPCAKEFQGTVDEGGAVVFSGIDGAGVLLWIGNLRVGMWENAAGSHGSNQARGRYQDGRIDALFDGNLGYDSTGGIVECSSFDHPLTFVRR